MSAIAKLMNQLAQAGIKLWLNGDNLKYQAAKAHLTDDLLADMKANKEAIVKFLQQHRLPFIADRSHAQPLSFAQERLWFLDQYEEGESAAYNSPLILRLKGELNRIALSQALTHMIMKHEVLRTRFVECEGQPLQIVEPVFPADLSVKQVELDNLNDEISNMISQPFSLEQFPLIQLALFEVDKQDHILVINQHHISTDGWSIKLLLTELAKFYNALINDLKPDLVSTAPQYIDYSLWQRQVLQKDPDYQQQLSYWVKQLKDVSNLDLHFDRKRPAKQTYSGDRLTFSISEALSSELQLLAAKKKVSLFMLLLAAFNVLLQRYSGNNDIAVGTPVANRHRPEFEETLGLFINTLVIRNHLESKQSFSEFLQTVKTQCLNAYSNQDVPFEKIVEELRLPRDLSRNPLFQVMFVLRNKDEVVLPDFLGINVESIDAELADSKFDLSLYISETDYDLACEFEYNTDLFDRVTIERLKHHWLRLLSGIVADSELQLGQYDLLTPGERHQLLALYNETQVAYPGDKTVNDLFAEQVRKTPNKIAAVFEEETLTYTELYNRSKQLAHAIRDLCQTHGKFEPETIVAVYGERSLTFFSTMLSVFKAGAAYLPLDPAYPAKRIEQVLKQSQARFILATAKQVERFRQQLTSLPESLHSVQVFVIEELLEQYTDTSELTNIITPDSLAYVMFTSGSTGLPKGAMVEHKGMVNHLYAKLNDIKATGEDVLIHNASQCFDISVFLFIAELVLGGKVVVVSEEVALDPVQLIGWIAREQVTLLEVVPSMIRILIDTANERGKLRDELGRLRWLISTGDALLPELCEQWFALYPDIPILNTYGPTECSDDVMHYAVYETPADKEAIVPIGYPIQNMKMYILDEYKQPVPIGVQGELYIGGMGVGLGYLNDEARTQEAFMVNPFSQEYDQRLYKTGDLVKRLQDGSIEFIGRLNSQVKIRGFRVGLGSIEAVLRQHPFIKTCVLHVVDHAQDKHLAAYCVIEKGCNDQGEIIPALRDYLKSELPEYMVPGFFIILDALPLNNNGKVDKKRLPQAEINQSNTQLNFQEAETATQKRVSVIWETLLETKPVSIHDNFFQVGGNSLLSVRLLRQISDTFKVEMPLKVIFENPTIAGLAEYLDHNQQKLSCNVLKSVDRQQPLPLSFAQQRLWFLEQYEEAKLASYSMPLAIRLWGELNITALEQSVNFLINRHEALRTRFIDQEGAAQQIVEDGIEINLNLEPVNEQQLQTRLEEEANYQFDLTKAPLCRVCLLQTKKNHYVLVINHHHIVSDGLSLRLFIEELTKVYQSILKDEPPMLPELSIQYADYAAWQRQHFAGQALPDELAFWRHELTGVEPLNLITDFPRPAIKSHNGKHFHFNLPKRLLEKAYQITQETGATLFMLLLGTLNILLSRHSQQNDVVVGTAVANRTNTQLENLIGLFVNTLALRTRLSDSMNFFELLQEVKQTCLAAYSHQELPFEELLELLDVKRDVSRDPIFQVMLVLHEKAENELPEFFGLETQLLNLETYTAKFDLSFNFVEVGNELRGIIEYNTDLFKESSIEQFSEQFAHLLDLVLTAPYQKLADYSLLTDQDEEKLKTWNNTETNFPHDKTIQQLFQKQVTITPDRIAVSFEGEMLSYCELDQRSSQVASHLIANYQVRKNSIVAVCLPRGLDLIVTLLGILKAGAAYLPIDSELPDERIQFILTDSSAAAFIIDQSQQGRFATVQNQLLVHELHDPVAKVELPRTTAEDLMYVIYTSGSTGEPKGVLLKQRGVVNRLVWMQQQYSINESDGVLQKTPYSFDVSVWELFWPLITGAKLVFATPDLHKDPAYLQQVIQKEKITILHFVPSMLRIFLNELEPEGAVKLSSLRQVFCSGEALSMQLVRQWQNYFPQVNFYNLYGPTEASIDVSYWDCKQLADTTVAPIGQPIANTKLYVLDNRLRQIPIGMVGELYIAGEGVARGYLNRESLNQTSFLTNPFISAESLVYSRLYKTNDLARWNHQGELEYLGRLDDQVKVRGLRIETGEIEAVLVRHSLVREAVVIAKEAESDKQLHAYLVMCNSATVNIDELREFLLKQLPAYMVPQFFLHVEFIPLSANGKADKKRLLELEAKQVKTTKQFVAPRTALEQSLETIWQDVLQEKAIGVHDDFFSLGGDSIMSIQLIAKARKKGLTITPKQLFVQPTIANLAKLIERQQVVDGEHSATKYNEGSYPLSPLKEGLLFHALFSPESDLYSTQFYWYYRSIINVAALKQAWQKLVDRHEILRSRFALQEDGKPRQFVETYVELPWTQLDWSGLNGEDQQAKLTNYLEVDREQSFELDQACLMRLHLIKLAENQFVFIWTYHHILLDGWSLPILLQELQTYYDAIVNSEPIHLDKPAPYSDYLSWLERQDQAEATSFWRQQLRAIKEPTNLGMNDSDLNAHGAVENLGELDDYFSTQKTETYKSLARHYKLSFNALLQAAWALVLSLYSGKESVVFGSTVSGRSGEVPGIENMVGLFINSLPMRMDIKPGQTVFEFLQTMHRTIQEANLYSYCSLSTIQKYSDVPAGIPLFHSLFVFENYPLTQAMLDQSQSLVASEVNGFGRTHFPLMLTVNPGESLHIQYAYDADQFAQESIQQLAEDMHSALGWIAFHLDNQVCEANFVSETVLKKMVRKEYYPASDITTDSESDYRLPQTVTEQYLLSELRTVLGINTISINTPFFELGGDSLLAVRYKFKVDKVFHIELPLAAIFNYPTIEKLANYIDNDFNMLNEIDEDHYFVEDF